MGGICLKKKENLEKNEKVLEGLRAEVESEAVKERKKKREGQQQQQLQR